MGLLHYSFKAPALTGQNVTATENTLPAVAGMVDIDFPVRFTERPTFTYGYEHGDNAPADSGLMPMVASVVSWKTGRRAETGHPFYDGARILISAPSVAVASGSSSGNPQVTLLRSTAQTISTESSAIQYETVLATAGAADFFTWDASTIYVNNDGLYRVLAYTQWTYPAGLTERRMRVIASGIDNVLWAVGTVTVNGPLGLTAAGDMVMGVGDSVSVGVYQYTGGTTFTNGIQRLSVEKLPDMISAALP